jgi:uncharacterized membrane protein YbhN (UPF0104 family)
VDQRRHEPSERRRRPSDAVRLVLAIVFVGAIAPLEARVSVDPALEPLATWQRIAVALFWLGVVGALTLAVGAALTASRWRAVRDLVLTALVAAAVAFVVPVPWAGTADGEWLVIAVSVGAAIAFGAGLLASRTVRRCVAWLTVLGIVAGVAAGILVPVDAVVAVLIGWGASAVIRLVFGCPQAVPSAEDVSLAGATFGIDLDDPHLQPAQGWGLATFTAAGSGGNPVDIAVYRRDAGDAQFFSRLWRTLWFKDSAPSLTLTRLQLVEHEAFALLMADRAEVGVPQVLAAGIVPSTKDAVLLTRPPAGRLLADVSPDELGVAELTEVWRNVDRLHSAGISHGHLTTRDIVIGADGSVTLIDLHHAETVAPEGHLLTDIAELLTGLALLVGPTKAVAAAAAVLDSQKLDDVLPLLQPAALLPPTRRALKAQPKLLDQLRDAGASAAGTDAPELAKLRRVTLSDVLMLVASGFGIYLVAGQLGSLVGMGPAIADATFVYLLIAMALGALTAVTAALAMTGAIATPLPFGPAVEVQLGNQFTGLVGGTLAITATNIRFVQKRGLSAALAVSAGITTSFAGFVVQLIIITVAIISIGPDLDLAANDESHTTALIVLIVIAIALGAIIGIPKFRKSVLDKVRAPLDAVITNLKDLFHRPSQLARVVGGVIGSQLLLAIALWFSLEAYGTTVPLFTLLLLNTLAALVGGVAPVPGGLGVIEGVLIEGLKSAGVPADTATVAVLSYRLVTAYLPPIWGWVALSRLRQRDYL